MIFTFEIRHYFFCFTNCPSPPHTLMCQVVNICSECYLFLDMGHLEITRGRQALELRSNLSERRSLTDPIRTPEHCSMSSSARNLQWAVAHGTPFFNICFEFIQSNVKNMIRAHVFTVLPQSLCLQFDCGVKVQLGFAAEFSNVMVIYTRILEKPKEISSCCAQLTDFPEVCSLILELRFKGVLCSGP